jgi:hypothetical protein
MTGSAKQSIAPQKERMDCFVAEFIIGPTEGGTRWLLAMTTCSRTPYFSPTLNGGSLPGGTVSSAIASSIATMT